MKSSAWKGIFLFGSVEVNWDFGSANPHSKWKNNSDSSPVELTSEERQVVHYFINFFPSDLPQPEQVCSCEGQCAVFVNRLSLAGNRK